MRKYLLLFLAAFALVAAIPTESKADVIVSVGPGYSDRGYYQHRHYYYHEHAYRYYSNHRYYRSHHWHYDN